MRLNLRKFWVVSGMAAVLMLPLFAHADSVDIRVNERNRGNNNDEGDGGYNSHFTWGIGIGGAPLGNGFGSLYSAGYGLDGNVGVDFNRHVALLLAMDGYVFNTSLNGIYSGEVNVMPTLRITFPSPGVKPYLLLGGGLNDNIAYVQTPNGTFSSSATSPVVGGGVGLAFKVERKWDIYLQAKYENVFANGGSFSYFPIALGVQFN